MSRNHAWQNTKVVCPYYKEEERQTIFCEASEGGLWRRSFDDPKKKAIYRSRFCQDDYPECELIRGKGL